MIFDSLIKIDIFFMSKKLIKMDENSIKEIVEIF